DDPTTATAVMNLNTKMAQNERYGSNLDRANSLLSAQDSTLTSVTGALDRIKALVLRAANDTYNDQDRLAVAVEIESVTEYLRQTANTQSSDGSYIFSGFTQGQEPFQQGSDGVVRYFGSTDVQKIEIAEQSMMAIGLPGSDVFGSQVLPPDSNGNARSGDFFSELANIVTALKNNDADSLRT
ncbi:MAG TPA: flagellar hook-associated protein 3, partial [Methylococcaceae bacterium]|nr:flagellar hook-associated protein 3 [Methylococcaceae bacterium]